MVPYAVHSARGKQPILHRQGHDTYSGIFLLKKHIKVQPTVRPPLNRHKEVARVHRRRQCAAIGTALLGRRTIVIIAVIVIVVILPVHPSPLAFLRSFAHVVQHLLAKGAIACKRHASLSIRLELKCRWYVCLYALHSHIVSTCPCRAAYPGAVYHPVQLIVFGWSVLAYCRGTVSQQYRSPNKVHIEMKHPLPASSSRAKNAKSSIITGWCSRACCGGGNSGKLLPKA